MAKRPAESRFFAVGCTAVQHIKDAVKVIYRADGRKVHLPPREYFAWRALLDTDPTLVYFACEFPERPPVLCGVALERLKRDLELDQFKAGDVLLYVRPAGQRVLPLLRQIEQNSQVTIWYFQPEADDTLQPRPMPPVCHAPRAFIRCRGKDIRCGFSYFECGTDPLAPQAVLPALGRPLPPDLPDPPKACLVSDWCDNIIGCLQPCQYWRAKGE